MVTKTAQQKGKERRRWALETAAALLRSDMDCFDSGEFDETESEKRNAAIRQIADELQRKAERMTSG